MAIMIPEEIEYYSEYSREDQMFNALKKLPDEYYVFHSYRGSTVFQGNKISDTEADFLIFNPNYGILIIEAKNGRIYRNENGTWFYSNGDHMKDPFNQASSSYYSLKKKFLKEYKNTIYESIVRNCKYLITTWFPSYTKAEIMNSNFGPNVCKDMILGKEALLDPSKYIEQIMTKFNYCHINVEYKGIIEDGDNYSHKLSYKDSILFLKNVLCPSFNIVESHKKNADKEIYLALLKEQTVVLDFLTDQRSAAIAGTAGTGKTLIALERARRLSEYGNKVLFLCFNSNLNEFFEQKYNYNNVDYYTIDKFACTVCHTQKANYFELNKILKQQINEGNFNYNHIIVDEGQDFGRDINLSEILNMFAEYGTNNADCSFFIFYDKYQLVNGNDKLPDYLNNVDSKLTLYRNCRNTLCIANTSYSIIEKEPIMYKNAISGVLPKLYYYESKSEFISKLNNLLVSLAEDEFDTTIITCGSKNHNSLMNYIHDDKYKYNNIEVPFYTASTFKGLESDNVIVIDVDKEALESKYKDFYVATSRAKKDLYLFSSMNEEKINEYFKNRTNYYKIKDKYKQLATSLKTVIAK